jgi:hypothetical protein
MALADFGRVWRLIRKVEELLSLQTEVRQSLQIIEQRLTALENRMLRLESDQTQIITEARSAATGAVAVVASSVVSDTVTRITRLEGRADQLEQRRLPPP